MGVTATRAARASTLAVAVALALTGVAAPSAAVATVGTTPTTTQLWLPDLNPKPVGRTTDLVAVVAPVVGAGTVTFYDTTGGGMAVIGSAPTTGDPTSIYQSRATYTAPIDMAPGTYQVVAVFEGNETYAGSQSTAVSFTVGPRPTATTVQVSGPHDASGATAQKSDVLTVSIGVVDGGLYTPNPLPIMGSVAIQVDGVAKATIILPSTSAQIPTSAWALGAHSIVAVFDPGTGVDFAGSQSAAASLSLVANVVDASGVGVLYTSFYPYRDGYRDTEVIRGLRLETASAAIRVYSPFNKLVKSFAIASGTGPYAATWTGRTSRGTILATGRYKVVQVLTDAFGAHRTVTSYVSLSTKRLYTVTTYLTKPGSSITSKGTFGVGHVTISTGGGYAKLTAPGSTMTGPGAWSGWAGVGYQFTLPAAAVYKSITFQVYRNGVQWSGPNDIKLQDFRLCPLAPGTWDEACFDHVGALGGMPATGWNSTTGSTTLNRSGRTVRGLATMVLGTFTIYKARIRVTYAILK